MSVFKCVRVFKGMCLCSQDTEKGPFVLSVFMKSQFVTPWGEGPGERRRPTDTDGCELILSNVEELRAIDYHLLDRGLGLLRGTPAKRIPMEQNKNPRV